MSRKKRISISKRINIFLGSIIFFLLSIPPIWATSLYPHFPSITTYNTIKELEYILRLYYIDHHKYPISGNKNLMEAIKSGYPDYYKLFFTCDRISDDYNSVNAEGEIIDSWGNPLVYINLEQKGGKGFLIYSYGPNEIDEKGQGDDISNIKGRPKTEREKIREKIKYWIKLLLLFLLGVSIIIWMLWLLYLRILGGWEIKNKN